MTLKQPTRALVLLVCISGCKSGDSVSGAEQAPPASARSAAASPPHAEPSEASPETDRGPTDSCPSYATPTPQAHLPEQVDEASGMVVEGTADAPVFWLINDSGDLARLYAVGNDGALLTTVLLDSVIAIDWEDLAEGPCGPDRPDAACLYIGDTGDNYRLRPWVPIHRLRLPATTPDFQRMAEGVETMRVEYPDGHHDAEALAVDEEGRVFLLTKDRNGTFSLYSATFEANLVPVRLDYHGTFDISDLPAGSAATVTAADFDPVSRRLLVRTYNAALEYRLAPGQALETLAGTEPVRVPVAEERQGESIAYGFGGYWHVSEGALPPLYFARCLGP